MTQTLWAGLAAMWLSACADVPVQSGEGGPRPADTCGADDYAGLVGTPIAAVTLPAELGARVIGPGDVVTTDFVPERLNIEVDEDGVVTGLRCG